MLICILKWLLISLLNKGRGKLTLLLDSNHKSVCTQNTLLLFWEELVSSLHYPLRLEWYKLHILSPSTQSNYITSWTFQDLRIIVCREEKFKIDLSDNTKDTKSENKSILPTSYQNLSRICKQLQRCAS